MITNNSNLPSTIPRGLAPQLSHSRTAHKLTSVGKDLPLVFTNAEWLPALRGDQGEAIQFDAHKALCTYLYTVAFNILWLKRSSVRQLSQYAPSEIEALAEDFVHSFCCKLIKNNYELLDKYEGRGRFLAWAAQVLRNMILSEFRKRVWRKTERLEALAQFEESQLLSQPDHSVHHKGRPDLIFQHNQLADLVEQALAKLSNQNQIIFLRYMLDGERANVVAAELGISTSAIYTAAHRIKGSMGEMLTSAGYA